MKQLDLNELSLVRGAKGSGGGGGVNPPKTYTTSNRGSGGGDGVEPPKHSVRKDF